MLTVTVGHRGALSRWATNGSLLREDHTMHTKPRQFVKMRIVSSHSPNEKIVVCAMCPSGDVMSPVLDLPLGSGSHTPVSSRMRSLTSRTPFRKYFIKFMHMSTTNMKLPAYENYFASLALSLKRGMNTLLYKRMSKTTRYVRVTLVVLCPLVLRVRQSMSG